MVCFVFVWRVTSQQSNRFLGQSQAYRILCYTSRRRRSGEDISNWISLQEIHGSDLLNLLPFHTMITISTGLSDVFVQRCLSGAGCLRIAF